MVHHCLVAVLFTGPSQFEMKFYRNSLVVFCIVVTPSSFNFVCYQISDSHNESDKLLYGAVTIVYEKERERERE